MNTIDVLSDPVKILWTGGWDSTFQLLRLLLSEHRRVEPHYLIDEDRPSTGAELSTMKRIRTTLGEVDEVATELLQPTTLCLVSEIPSRPRISQAFESIQRRRGIGGQYDWLARYCEARGIAGLQLCIHEDDKAALAIAQMIAEGHNDRQPAALDDRYSDTDEYVVFRYFEFPILDLSKTDMADIARACGWERIMNMTWFCHDPRNGKPCGRCNPCVYTMAEGLAWRVPIHRRVMGKLHRVSVQPAMRCSKKLLQRLHRGDRRTA